MTPSQELDYEKRRFREVGKFRPAPAVLMKAGRCVSSRVGPNDDHQIPIPITQV
jgi:hypothetical protein